MAKSNDRVVAIRLQGKGDYGLSRSQSLDATPSEHKFPTWNDLEIIPLYAQPAGICKAEDALGLRIGHRTTGEPSRHLIPIGQQRKHRRRSRPDQRFALDLALAIHFNANVHVVSRLDIHRSALRLLCLFDVAYLDLWWNLSAGFVA